MPDPMKAAAAALRKYALTFPGAVEDFPWGDRVFKVRGKIFLFLGRAESGDLGLSVKLPESSEFALSMDGITPTGYGLGQHGWVSAKFPAGAKPPVDLVRAWIDESYRAIAPKKLIAELDGPSAVATKPAKAERASMKKKKATSAVKRIKPS